jgi:hypothetical protein
MWAEDASYLHETYSKARRPPRPNLAVGLEAIYHHLSLGLILPEISEDLLLFGVVLSYPLSKPSTKPSMYSSSRCRLRWKRSPLLASGSPGIRRKRVRDKTG